ncbi:MAG: hypothetical protein H3C43_05490 [Leptonema sp. (in: Bacteria)]|nr:hypothetical protein [Leptonema sp. (in: bacteria)]
MNQKLFEQSKYFVRKKFWKIFGGEIKIYDETESQLLCFVKQKAFKLKEDIRVFTDESMSQELFLIKARSIIDFGASYDVTDSTTNERVGTLRRKGLKSILRDSWQVLNSQDQQIGQIEEDSMALALMRRFISGPWIPQSYAMKVGDKVVGMVKQTFNPFVPRFRVDFSMDTNQALDRRLGIASVVLLGLIEGKQQGAN